MQFSLLCVPKLHQTTTFGFAAIISGMLLCVPKLHQTTTTAILIYNKISCCVFQNYIKPQPRYNIGICRFRCCVFQNYIKPQPGRAHQDESVCCCVFQNYIKPQLMINDDANNYSCCVFQNYIKPQPSFMSTRTNSVVVCSKITSNHNSR